LADGIAASGAGRLALYPDGNEVFAVIARDAAARLREAGAGFYDWPAEAIGLAEAEPGAVLIRLVTCFRTTAGEVDRFLAVLDA
ncbi:MAG: low specificity L-threonine aldolase, partial [Rhizobiales bacterium]|nr:low specificity L-threonine aldolase [Hyphomicrobiales bacterium]